MAVTINTLNAGNMTVTLDNPALTRVTYTESSGLAPWSAEITGNIEAGNQQVTIPHKESIKTLKAGTSATGIAAEAFYDSTMMESVELPKEITYVGNDAFHGCTSLTILTISNLTQIQADAFAGCTNITTVHITDDGGDSEAQKQAMINPGKIPDTASVNWILDGSR